jgi:hypothetical protein
VFGLDPVSLLEVDLLQDGARGVVDLLVEGGGEGGAGDLLSALGGGGSDALSMSAKGDEVRVVRAYPI